MSKPVTSVDKISLTNAAKFTGTDKGDATRELQDAGLVPEPGPKGADLYPLGRAIRILVARKESDRMNTVEQLNRERAEKTRIEREILERNHRPVEEMLAAITNIAAAINAELELMPAESQEKIAQAIRAAMGGFQE